MGHRSVAATALHTKLKRVERRHHRPRMHRETAGCEARPIVHRIDLVDRETVEQTVLEHHPRAALVFLGRLENEHHGALARWVGGHCTGRAEQHGGVAVMPAGVHFTRHLRCIRQPGCLRDVERVDIGAQTDRPTLAVAQHAHHPCSGEALVHLEPHRARPRAMKAAVRCSSNAVSG